MNRLSFLVFLGLLLLAIVLGPATGSFLSLASASAASSVAQAQILQATTLYLPYVVNDFTTLSPTTTAIGVESIAEGLVAPLGLVPANDDSGRMFIVDQVGLIWVMLANGEILGTPFLDLRDRMRTLNPDYDECGLLGLAFHPAFAENGRFFVYYSAPRRAEAPAGWDHTNHLSEFMASQDANIADAASERILLQVDQPQFNHNAGQIAFGPDGYLYVPLGDGGGGDDVGLGHPPLGNGQDITTLLGSILRLDVDSGDPYAIPADNPFVGADGRDEIYAYGFRNPYRISFDAGGEHRLFASDTGQSRFEEVDIVTLGGNYGWNIKEGTHCFDPNNPGEPPADCPDVGAGGEPLIDPIIEYANIDSPGGGIGEAVVGGIVYRGTNMREFQGRYLFADWSQSDIQPSGTLLMATEPTAPGALWPVDELDVVTPTGAPFAEYIRSFGSDTANDMYVLTSRQQGPSGDTGRVYRLVSATETPLVSVVNQDILTSTVTAAEVVSNGPGWLVIYAESQAGGLRPIIGHVAVPDGRSLYVTVPINQALARPILFARLHQDAGTLGSFEPNGADVPVDVDGMPVIAAFGVHMGPPTESVEMVNRTFVPRVITVTMGTSITWTNRDGLAHTTTSDTGIWSSDTLSPGDTYSVVFDVPGTFPYHCMFHGGSGGIGMSGTVVVQP